MLRGKVNRIYSKLTFFAWRKTTSDISFGNCRKKLYDAFSQSQINLEPINVVVPFESVDQTPVCDHSNESY